MTEERAVVERVELASSEGYGRDFRLYAAGQMVSVAGDRIATIALVFLIIHLSHAYAPAVALYYFCTLLPTLLGGLLAGALADHFNRRRLMIGCDLGRGVLLAAVPALSFLSLWAVYPIVFVVYGLSLLFDTAANAALPDVVPEDRMMGANSILQGIRHGADVAYAIGGALVYVLKFQAPFYLDAATFLFSALMISGMRIPSPGRGPMPRMGAIVKSIREGIAYLLGHPFLRWSTLTFALAPLAGGVVFVLTPLYASRSLAPSPGLAGPLHSGAFRFSVLEVCLGVGAIFGAALAPRLSRRIPRGTVFAIGMLGLGLAYILPGFTTNLYLVCAILMVVGLFNSLFLVAGWTLAQTLTPSELRGRVVSARLTVSFGALALGNALGGVLLLVVSYSALWILAGAIIAASSLFIWIPSGARGQA